MLATQEIMINAAKHSGATHFWLDWSVSQTDTQSWLVLHLKNNGLPFNFEQESRGLDNVRRRLKALQGTIQFASIPLSTEYKLFIPVHQ